VGPDAAAVSVAVPAAPGSVHLLRTVAGGVASRLGWTLDRIDDLRLGVDEAAGRVLAAGPATRLHMSIHRSGSRIQVVVSSDAAPGAWPDADPGGELSLQILSALVDEVRVEATDEGPSIGFSADGALG
jgi:serine/threonine-protein kinase RsbW